MRYPTIAMTVFLAMFAFSSGASAEVRCIVERIYSCKEKSTQKIVNDFQNTIALEHYKPYWYSMPWNCKLREKEKAEGVLRCNTKFPACKNNCVLIQGSPSRGGGTFF